jgi:hypothetical protein
VEETFWFYLSHLQTTHEEVLGHFDKVRLCSGCMVELDGVWIPAELPPSDVIRFFYLELHLRFRGQEILLGYELVLVSDPPDEVFDASSGGPYPPAILGISSLEQGFCLRGVQA